MELSSGSGEVLQKGRRPEHLWGLLDNLYLTHFWLAKVANASQGIPGGSDIQTCVLPSPCLSWRNQPGCSMGLRDPRVRAGIALTPLGWDAVGGQRLWRVLSSEMGHPWVLFWGGLTLG